MQPVVLNAALTPSWVLIGAVHFVRSIVPEMHLFHALRAQRKRQKRHISFRHVGLDQMPDVDHRIKRFGRRLTFCQDRKLVMPDIESHCRTQICVNSRNSPPAASGFHNNVL